MVVVERFRGWLQGSVSFRGKHEMAQAPDFCGYAILIPNLLQQLWLAREQILLVYISDRLLMAGPDVEVQQSLGAGIGVGGALGRKQAQGRMAKRMTRVKRQLRYATG